MARCLDRLDHGNIEALVKILRACPSATDDLVKTVTNQADRFERSAKRMRYPIFRAPGLFVGSVVIEAGCKTVISSCPKGFGMFWTVVDYWADRSPSRLTIHIYVAHPLIIGLCVGWS